MARVQDQVAEELLEQFHRPLSVSVIRKIRDWPTRQKIGYESIKGLLNQDWHGLQDFQEQMELYSSTHFILKAAWRVIKSLVPNNRQILLTLFRDRLLGQVGRFLRTLHGFDRVFALAPEELDDLSGLSKRLG